MIELGKTQCLNIVKVTDFGVYLGTEEDKVLLPKKQVPDDVEVGDALTVFVYRDSSDRLIATTNKPKIQLGELKRLKVSQVTGIGAFLDWGLEKRPAHAIQGTDNTCIRRFRVSCCSLYR